MTFLLEFEPLSYTFHIPLLVLSHQKIRVHSSLRFVIFHEIRLVRWSLLSGVSLVAARDNAAGTGSEAQFDPKDQVNNKGTDNVNHHASTELINGNQDIVKEKLKEDTPV